MERKEKALILGAGISGLTAGAVTGYPVYETNDFPGGICASFYVRPGEKKRLYREPVDGNAYRFEIGGGHWIFGADENVLSFMKEFSPVKEYKRSSGVYFRDNKSTVPYPLQNNLRFLDKETARKALEEVCRDDVRDISTMAEWLLNNFGRTLCDKFFFPFHKAYTAGLYREIAPQDPYKSPIDITSVKSGAEKAPPTAGYNATFFYPENGLDHLTRAMARKCRINFGRRVSGIDIHNRKIFLRDGAAVPYECLWSTLPLGGMLDMTGLMKHKMKDPYTSVLVLNMGALKGADCPEEHWLYIPDSVCGFHRVGFYSNVDDSFLPGRGSTGHGRVSIYVEKAYPGGCKPSSNEIDKYTENVVRELKDWGFIRDVEVADVSWVDVAYTWSRPGSDWREVAINELEKHGIYQMGRYARWKFQGIAESIKEGLSIRS